MGPSCGFFDLSGGRDEEFLRPVPPLPPFIEHVLRVEGKRPTGASGKWIARWIAATPVPVELVQYGLCHTRHDRPDVLREVKMFRIIVMCVAAWVTGMVFSWTAGGAIHLLLVAAITLFLTQIVRVRPEYD